MSASLLLAAIACAVLTTANSFGGSTLIEHLGANDPTTEGWILGIETPGFTAQPVFDDLGFDAWQLSTMNSADVKYGENLSPDETTLANSQGWSLTATTRVLQADPGGMVVRYSSGTTIYSMEFSISPANELVVAVGDFEMGMGSDSTTYNSYALIDDSGNGLVDFYYQEQ